MVVLKLFFFCKSFIFQSSSVLFAHVTNIEIRIVQAKQNYHLVCKSFFQSVCMAMAICLHYFLIAMFCWMLVEGVHLYLMLVRVFQSGSHMKKYMAIGWGKSTILNTLYFYMVILLENQP